MSKHRAVVLAPTVVEFATVNDDPATVTAVAKALLLSMGKCASEAPGSDKVYEPLLVEVTKKAPV
jgi:hypothetical protein